MTLHAGALLVTVRYSGRLADRRGRRLPVMLGFGSQALVFVLLANLPPDAPLWVPFLGITLHGGAAGMSLAVLHRIAMDDVATELAGAAAGLYSMVRFFGSVIGATIGGVILAQALATLPYVADAYHVAFICWAAVAVLALLIVWRVRDNVSPAA
jgi:MFS family permease